MNNSCLGGYVTSPRDFIGKQRKIDQNGLFSEQIFGPTQNFCCACGNYNNATLYKNMVCPKCNVQCTTNDLRFTTFGKIKTLFPFVNPNRRSKLLKIIGNTNSQIIDPIRADANSANSYYLGIKTDLSDIKIFNTLNSDTSYLIIPFRITGIYSLYIVLKFINTYIKNCPEVNEIFDNNYYTTELLVLPPNLRMVSYDSIKKEIRSPEINKFYTSVLNLNRNLEMIKDSILNDEEMWINKIYTNVKDHILDQDIFEPGILNYDREAAILQYHIEQIYQKVYSELSGKY